MQPTVHFAEDTLVHSEDEEAPQFPSGKQRLIRKDTPHYKKHFRIAQLPRPEAVVALLQGFGASGGPQEEQEEEEEAPEQAGWGQEEAASEGTAAPPSVKVRAFLRGGLTGQGCGGEIQAFSLLAALAGLSSPARLLGGGEGPSWSLCAPPCGWGSLLLVALPAGESLGHLPSRGEAWRLCPQTQRRLAASHPTSRRASGC